MTSDAPEMIAEYPLPTGLLLSPNSYIGLGMVQIFIGICLLHSWLFACASLLYFSLALSAHLSRRGPPRLQLYADHLKVIGSLKTDVVALSDIESISIPKFAGLRVGGYCLKARHGRPIWLPVSEGSSQFLTELDSLRDM